MVAFLPPPASPALTAPPPLPRLTVLYPQSTEAGGAIEEYACRLASRLCSKFRVRLVTPAGGRTPTPDPVGVGSDAIVHLPVRELFRGRILLRRDAWKTLHAAVLDSDMVHLHMPFPIVERWVARWTRRVGVPMAITYHAETVADGAWGRTVGRIVTRGYRALSAHPALRSAEAIVASSAGYAGGSPVLARYFAKITVVRKGVDLERLQVDPGVARVASRVEPARGLLPESQPGERRVLFVGTLSERKGLPELLWATALLLKTGLPVRTYIAGWGPAEGRLKRLTASMGLGDRVRFLGPIPDDRLGELYRAADVVTSPCTVRLAPTPVSLEEAVACGTPIVGSALPGNDEALPNDGVHGTLVPAGNVPALAQALRRHLLLPRPHWKLSLRTWDDTARDYAELFDRLRFELRLATALHLPRAPSAAGPALPRAFKVH
ncbi:MAG TPA: glycosyltransferase [Thermoplasmata archaeon]|nr:glycosyltransferase [Thermoplasmata archaeon]